MPQGEMKEQEVPDAHFTVDKQNISLWPRDLPSKPDLSPGLRKPLTARVAFICLSLVLVTSIVLQAVFYPWLLGKISDVKRDAQVLRGHVDNFSNLSSDLLSKSGRVQVAEVQIQMVNASLNRVQSQILSLGAIVERASAQIQGLTRNWEEVDHLNAQIPEVKRDLDKASALNAKVRGLQSSLENLSKLLKGQNDILRMVSQGWKYFKENFYYFSHTPKTWYSAEQFCISRKAHLTSVTSESEQEFLYKTTDGLPHWIGLTKAGSEGNWYWVDETPFNKQQSGRFWIPGEPNNVGNNEHCVNIRVSSLQSWNDASCDDKLLFICKQPYTHSDL
ncbi:C-type lectin domain family 4 member K [Nannospalax galili]|uniref:C-type lectin domain family 4 member K n=1 Tax=Nannospalax galili TaxID=1026970 RepID=A0A8C6RX38_NANGA|nr:C-type lectin domain family 4 member K [Nannospalax galili]